MVLEKMAGSFWVFILSFALFRAGLSQPFLADIARDFCRELAGEDNLSCPNETIQSGACFPRTQLCDGIVNCENLQTQSLRGADEGFQGAFSSLECE
jgi:hypothetical protein